MAQPLTDKHPIFLATLPAGRGARRRALAVVLVSAAIFLAAAPFAKVPLTPVWAFIPTYESALAINDLITAVLLFGQYSFLRSRALIVLASGYLFTAFMAVPHALTFPGLFAPTGLLGAGPQSTAWLYMFWHGGFPLFVIAYARLKTQRRETSAPQTSPAVAVLGSIAAVLAAVCAFALLATAGQDLLPAVMVGHHYTPALIFVVSSVWGLSLAALFVLWRQRPHTVLDLWLMVVLCAWLFDIALAAMLNAGRFDLGFYAGRIYGLLAASFVLIVLLTENSVLYARLVEALAGERREHQRALEKTNELIAANKDLDAFTYSVSHDLRAPLRAIDGYGLMLEEDYRDRLDAEAMRYIAVIRGSSKRMGTLIDDLLALSRLGRQAVTKVELDMNKLVQDVIDEALANRADKAPKVELGPLPPAKADRALLRQVWTNLISNAVKYSSQSPNPVIEVSGRQVGDENVYSVKDNGVGFSMEYADKLFGVFQRLHRADEFGGSGVGLAIVHRLVARHGGRVWAEGKVNEGAVFSFALPTGERT